MADFIGNITAKGQQTTAAAKTLLQIQAPTNHRVKILCVSIFFHGLVNTNEPITVELVRQSSTGTSTTCTPTKNDNSLAESLLTSAAYLFTSESTPGDILETWAVHPQVGLVYPFPPESMIKLGGGGKLGLRVTATNSVTADCNIKFEE